VRRPDLAGDEMDDLAAVVPALLRSLDALAFAARHVDPARPAAVLEAAGAPGQALREALPRLDGWPERLAGVRAALRDAGAAVLAGLEGLGAAVGDLRGLHRALRQLPRAEAALYPLAARLAPVSRYFLSPAARGDDELQRRLAQAPAHPDTGVFHFGDASGSRGGFSLYVPEYYAPDRDWPLVAALHGGAGNGGSFLWSWLRDARSAGAILLAPTAVGDTWALSGPDRDTPNLARILGEVRGRWCIDAARLLLTGMSDGGTFSYVSGLEAASPFTHLAPVAAAFHPLIAEMADPDRIIGLPIHLVHGALDWMFPVALARQAERALAAAGAKVTYLEIADLRHAYPREANPAILDWLGGA